MNNPDVIKSTEDVAGCCGAERGSDAESLARQIAYIIGPSSAAQSAINELERKRRTGQPAYIHKVGNSWIVQTVRPNADVSDPRRA